MDVIKCYTVRIVLANLSLRCDPDWLDDDPGYLQNDICSGDFTSAHGLTSSPPQAQKAAFVSTLEVGGINNNQPGR